MSTDAMLAERSLPVAQAVDGPALADVTVTVSPEGDVSCTPDPLVVSVARKTIVFRMATAGWNFTPHNAIVVSQPGSDFPQPSQTQPGGRLATLLDRDLRAGAYAYTVNVYEPSTGRKGSVDPTIENQPD
jgi:hypothetical protein